MKDGLFAAWLPAPSHVQQLAVWLKRIFRHSDCLDSITACVTEPLKIHLLDKTPLLWDALPPKVWKTEYEQNAEVKLAFLHDSFLSVKATSETLTLYDIKKVKQHDD